MNMGKQKRCVSICVVVCLILLCGTMTRGAEDAVVVQDAWVDDVQVQIESVEMIAESAKIAAINDEIPAERVEVSAINDEVSVTESKIHTQVQADAIDAVCLPTGKVIRGFGWQEEDGIWRYHGGADIVYAKGEDVRAIMGGTVRRVEKTAGGYALEVAGGGDVWRYEPLADVGVASGERITAGAVLGTACEESTLHIGRQHNGEWIDPISMQN